MPGQPEVPAGAKVRSYPTHEKNNIVWIWMGDADKADVDKIPDLPWLSDPKWAATPGRLYVKTNYQFIIDNLLDLTHVAHVHKKTIAGDPREATTPTKTERLPDGVRVGRWMIDFVPPPLFAKAGNFNENVDRWQFVTWHPPGVVYLDVGCAKAGTGAPQGDRSQGISIWSSHLITPETEHSSHYMFGFSRDFKTDDKDMSKLLFEGSRATFLEDVEFLEAVQNNRFRRLTRRPDPYHCRRRAASGAADAEHDDRRGAGTMSSRMRIATLAFATLAMAAPGAGRDLSVAAGDDRGAVCRRRRLGPAGAAGGAEARGEARQAVHHREPAGRGDDASRHAGGARDARRHTLMQATSSTMAINVSMSKKMPYEPLKDLVPVALLSSSPFFLVVNNDSPVKTGRRPDRDSPRPSRMG